MTPSTLWLNRAAAAQADECNTDSFGCPWPQFRKGGAGPSRQNRVAHGEVDLRAMLSGNEEAAP